MIRSKKKSILALFLALVLFMSLFPLPIGAVEHEQGEGIVLDFDKVGLNGEPGDPEGWMMEGDPTEIPRAIQQPGWGLAMQSVPLEGERTFQFPIEQAGTYELYYTGLTRGHYGTAELIVNDDHTLGPFDFYGSERTSLTYPAGKINLSAGMHTLTIRSVGKNDSSLGYDLYHQHLELVPVEPELLSLSLEAEADILEIGETTELVASGVMSNGEAADLSSATIAYESSDESVLQVQASGDLTAEVTALANGTATVTATVTLDDIQQQVSVTLGVGSEEIEERFVYEFRNAGLDGEPGTPEGFVVLGVPADTPPRVVQANYGLSLQTNPTSPRTNSRSFDLPVEKSGTYKIKFLGWLGRSGGLGEILINDAVVGEYNFYSDVYEYGETIDMADPINLTAGTHQLTFKTVSLPSTPYMYVSEFILEKIPSQLSSLQVEAARSILLNDETLQLELSGELSDESAADLNQVTVHYESSNEDVLSVNSDGLVTAISSGSATVTVIAELNGSEQQASIDILVLGDALQNIQLDFERSTLLPGQTTVANVTGYSEEGEEINLSVAEIEFTSFDEDIATIDEKGNITAHQLGSAMIQVTVTLLETVITEEQQIEITNKVPDPQPIPVFTDRWQTITSSNGMIHIDGQLNETDWQGAASLSPFVTAYYKRQANPDTQVMLTYDEEYLYVGIQGDKLADDEHVLSDGFEIVIAPNHDFSKHFKFLHMLKENPNKQLTSNFSRFGPAAANLRNVTVETQDSSESWTAEVAIPLASLDVGDVPSGEEWYVNVLRHRPGVQPLSSWVPIRQSQFTDNELPNSYVVYATLTGQARLGRVYFEKTPLEAVKWIPESFTLMYDGFTEKSVSFHVGDLNLDEEAISLAWRTPIGTLYSLDEFTYIKQDGIGRITFTHPRLDTGGLYQLDISVEDTATGVTHLAIAQLDREDVIAAGEQSLAWEPKAPAKKDVEYSEPSAEVQRLLDLIPEQVGIVWAGLPDKPELRPYQLFDWDPNQPDQLTSTHSDLIYPNPLYPEDQVLEVENAKGEIVEYPYYEDDEGRKYFHTAHLWYKKRNYVMEETFKLAASDPLGAARLLERFAEVYEGYVPVYDRLWVSYPLGNDQGPPYPYYGGTWDWWYYQDLRKLAQLANAYDFVKQTNALELLSEERDEDVQGKIVDGMFKKSVEFTRTYSHWFHNMDYVLWQGLIPIANAIDEPDYIHETIEWLQKFVTNEFMFDGFYKELTLSYHAQSINGTQHSVDQLKGWSSPQGHVSQRIGDRIDSLDLNQDFATLRQAHEIKQLLAYPNGHYVPIQDTWAYQTIANPNTAAGSFLLPASGIARLTQGHATDQSQLYMMFEPKYGHNHWDPLNLTLFAHGQELLPDIGYTHTNYRQWTASTLAHNTVVVNAQNMQNKAGGGGNLEVFAPQDETVQVMKTRQENAYEETSEYSREPWYISFPGSDDGYVLDVFRVTGGERHDYTLQGDANHDAIFTTDIDMQTYGDYLLPEGTEVQKPTSESDRGYAGGHYFAYMFVNDVERGEIPDGKYQVTLSTEDEGIEKSSLQITGLVNGTGVNELFLGRSPSLRMTRTENLDQNDLIDDYSMPKLVLRREGTELNSTFITAMEPFAAGASAQIQQVDKLELDQGQEGDVAIAISYGNTTDIIVSSNDDSSPLLAGDIELHGKMGFIRMEDGQVTKMLLLDGTKLVYGNHVVRGEGTSVGEIESVLRTAQGDPYNAFVTSSVVPSNVKGQYMVVEHPDGQTHGYEIQGVLYDNDKSIIQLTSEPGFTIYPDGTSQLQFFPATQWRGTHTFSIRDVRDLTDQVYPSRIEIQPEQWVMKAGETSHFRVMAHYEDTSVVDVTYEASLTSSDHTIISVNNDGALNALQEGRARIQATFDGKIDSFELFVTPHIMNVEAIQQHLTWLINMGAFANEQAAHALTLHLTAVGHFEQQGAADKIIQHMTGFKLLLDHQRANELLTDQAYQVLTADADAWLDLQQESED